MPELNYTDPINLDHPLGNKIAQGNWWKVLPDGPRGLYMRDLCAKNTGTLTGGASWSYSRSPYNRFGSVSVAGASQEVLFGTPAWLAGATQGTIAGWIYRASTSNTISLGSRSTTDAGGDRFVFNWYTDGNVYIQAQNGAGVYPSVPLAGTGWHFIAMTFDGSLGVTSRVVGYIDGKLGSKTTNGTEPTSLVSDPEQFGFGRDQATRWGTGSADDIFLLPWALSAGEVRQLYDATLQDYSPLLNWDNDDWWWAKDQPAASTAKVPFQLFNMVA